MTTIKKINLKKRSAAFSLIEVMVALSILSLILGGLALFSVRTIQAHTRSQAMQNALENARFAMENINKLVRTSQISYPSEDSFDASSITFTTNLGEDQYAYRFESTDEKLQVSRDDGLTWVDLVGGDQMSVSGHFEVLVPQTDQRGFVATEITIHFGQSGTPSEEDSVTVRSGVSLRY